MAVDGLKEGVNGKPRGENPYLSKKGKLKAPILMKVPMYDFKNPRDLELGLEPEELCIARIPNTKDYGYIHHVGLTYKNLEGEVFSLTMTQHHGELKEGTDAKLGVNSKLTEEEDLSKDPLPEFKKKKKWSWPWKK